MAKIANQIVYWPGTHFVTRNICDVVTDVIQQLQIMQMNHSSLQKHQGKLFRCESADYFELKGQHYLSLVDRFSE